MTADIFLSAALLTLCFFVIMASFLLLPLANEVWGKVIFLHVCHSVHRGGACGCRGHVWLLGGAGWGACMVGGACMRGCRGACMVVGGVQRACIVAEWGAWLWGACVVVGGVCGCRGCAWLLGGMHRTRRDTVTERAVGILLECILVFCDVITDSLD